MHLDTEQIQRVLHGEVPSGSSADVAAHLATCESCRSAVARARADEEEVHGLLGALDHPRRPADIRRVRAAARPMRRVLPFRRAAGLLLTVGLAGVAYAMPSSPLRRWIDALRAPTSREIAPDVTSGARTAPDISGVSVSPGASALLSFTSPQSAGEIRVTLADVRDIEVRAPVGAVKFAAGPGRLTIENAGSTVSYEVRVPRAAPRVEIQVAGMRVWLKEGERPVGDFAPGTDGVVRIPLLR